MQVKIYLQIISEVNSECPGFVNADLKAIRRIINGMKQTEKLRDELGSVRPWSLVGVCDIKLNLLNTDGSQAQGVTKKLLTRVFWP